MTEGFTRHQDLSKERLANIGVGTEDLMNTKIFG
jgi:hypothetical protein